MHMVVCTSLLIYTHTHMSVYIYCVREREGGIDLIEPLIRVAVVYFKQIINNRKCRGKNN